MKTKIAVLAAVLSLAAAPASFASHNSGKGSAPGKTCASLKVKGKKTANQRAAYKECVKAAAKARGHHGGGNDDGGVTPPEESAPAA